METGDWKEPTIKVIGVGGAGSNAVDRMIQIGIRGVEFIAANSDAQALTRSEAPHQVALGPRTTRSLGAGGNPTMGAKAAYESQREIRQALRGADMVFIAAGMGGGTGTGAAPVVAKIAQVEGALTVAVVTTPFAFEGNRRSNVAEQGIERLKETVDTLIVISNDRLLEVVDRRVSLDISFRIADEVLRQSVQAISELITRPGLINLDFADVKSIIAGAGTALISIGHGEGQQKGLDAARMALRSPLLNIDSISQANGLLVNITGGPDLRLAEVNAAMEMISQAAISDAQILFGAIIEPRMEGQVEITVISTGISEESQPAALEETEERIALADVLGEELAVPAYMRSAKHINRMGGLDRV